MIVITFTSLISFFSMSRLSFSFSEWMKKNYVTELNTNVHIVIDPFDVNEIDPSLSFLFFFSFFVVFCIRRWEYPLNKNKRGSIRMDRVRMIVLDGWLLFSAVLRTNSTTMMTGRREWEKESASTDDETSKTQKKKPKKWESDH
jgi:hypothetical protein